MFCFVIYSLFLLYVHDLLRLVGVGVMFMWERGKW